jgi:hypothetical protein
MHQAFIHWANDPLSIRAYLVFLVIASCICIWRFLDVSRHLYRIPIHGKFSLEDVRKGQLKPEELGMAVFAGKIPVHFGNSHQGESGRTKTDEFPLHAQSLEIAENRFRELSFASTYVVGKVKRVIVQIILVSGLLLTLRIRGLARGDYQFGLSSVPGSVLFFGQVVELFSALTLGLLICVTLYALWNYFDNVVARRRSRGNEFFRRVRQTPADRFPSDKE